MSNAIMLSNDYLKSDALDLYDKNILEGNLALIIADNVRARKMFTAYDITKVARTRKLGSVAHQVVKDYVHGAQVRRALDMAGYTRTSVILWDGSRAYVYHPMGTDSNDYVEENRPRASVVSMTVMAITQGGNA